MSTLKPTQTERPGSAGATHTFRQGDFLVTVLSDGYISVPEEVVMAGADPVAREAIISRLPKAAHGVRAYANIPILRAGSEVIVFDVGGGGRYQPTEGRFVSQLADAAIAASAVTKIVLTHAHPDHIWGIQDEYGSALFRNAIYYIGRTEWDFWMDPDFETKVPAMLREFGQGTRSALGAIKDRVHFLHKDQAVVAGVRAIETPGHTLGHLSFEIAGGAGLLIAADVATSPIVSFEHPEWVFGFDTLPEAAIKSRQRFLDRAAADRTRMLGYHWPYPGLGHAERRGMAFQFVPDP